jgi:hypothetical protein
MANLIKIKRSAVPGKVPTTGDLQLGELALNTYDGKLYSKKNDGSGDSVFQIGNQLSSSLTFNSTGSGGASGTVFDGASPKTISFNTIGAAGTSGTNATGTWGISVTGSAVSLTNVRTLWGQNFNGTANVSGNLSSVGNITGSGALTLTSTLGALGLSATGANSVSISTNGTVRVHVASDGKVGFGTTSPETRVHIEGVLGFGSSNNIKIGNCLVGSSITSGTDNFFAGAFAGRATTTGGLNNFIGFCAGGCNVSGSVNNFIGSLAGRFNTTGFYNNFFGRYAGRCNTTGSFNNFFGRYAGFYSTTGNNNIFVGRDSGLSNITGNNNTFVGPWSGYGNNAGNNNTFIGSYTGISTDRSDKVIIGRGFDSSNLFDSPNTTSDTQLAIGIRTSASPSNYWIVGDQNFNVGIGTNPTQRLDVNGNLRIRSALYDGSNAVGSAGSVLTSTTTGTQWKSLKRTVGATIDGGGGVITTGTKGYVEVPYSGTIEEWKIVSDVSGSIVFDVWKSNAAIPTNANSITASAKPTLTSSQRATSTTLTGWTNSVLENDVFGFEVESASLVTKATLILVIRQT